MNELIRKAVLLGIGTASLTKEKADKVIKGFVKKGAITTKEGRALVSKVLVEAKKEKKRIEVLIKKEAKSMKSRLTSLEKRGASTIKKKKQKKGKKR